MLSCLLGVTVALPSQLYNPPPQQPPQHQGYGTQAVECREGQVDRGDGTCVTPIVTRELYLYNAPEVAVEHGPAPKLPDPKILYNLVFVRTPEAKPGPKPLVAPAPQQKTLVYVLTKKGYPQQQELIQVESKPTKPEVYFVNYKEGANVDLPGGIDLRTALSQSHSAGEEIQATGGGYQPPPRQY